MTQLNYINKPIFDHGAIEQISEVLRGMGKKASDMYRSRPSATRNVRSSKKPDIK